MLGLKSDAGLATVLSGDRDWRSCLLQLDGLPDLYILPSGQATRRAADLVGRGLPLILQEAAREYDLVVVDSPPLLGFPEPLQLAAAVDGVILLTLAGQTPRKAVAGALEVLNRVRANTIGLVLNEVTSDLSDSYYYYGYYGKYYKYYRHYKSA
jgi:Mrp family chromosome partitioning ATPase